MSIVPMLIDHCSPTLASLKCGSLFSVTPEDMAHTRREAQALSDALAPKGLAIRVIDVGDGRALCYLYRPGQLRCVLAGERKALSSPNRATLICASKPRAICFARVSRRAARFRMKSACFWAIPSTMWLPLSPTKGATACAAAAGSATPTRKPHRKRFADSASAPASISACSPAEERSISWPWPHNAESRRRDGRRSL